MTFPDRGDWKQWFLLTVQYCLMYVGIAAIATQAFKWSFVLWEAVFVGFVSGAVMAFVPTIQQPAAAQLAPGRKAHRRWF
jgi:hypothetical protein